MTTPLERGGFVLGDFILVTGNRHKLAEARRILGCDVEAVAVDLPEVQDLDLGRVLGAKAEEAWHRLGRPLVVEDTAFELDALNGFPGPLIKWLLEAVGPEGVARLGLALGNPRARARCQLLFRDADRQIVAEGVTAGELVLPARGDGGFGWDPVFRPDGEMLTYGELTPARKDEIGHRGRAWRALAAMLAKE